MLLNNEIQHHQRILLTGSKAPEILSICERVLDFHNKPYDIMNDGEKSISGGPIVFIIGKDDLNQYDPHIVLLDEGTVESKEKYMELASGMPKSGTLVYNASNKMIDEICSMERTDVFLEKYYNDDSHSIAMKILKRIGVSGQHFDQAQ